MSFYKNTSSIYTRDHSSVRVRGLPILHFWVTRHICEYRLNPLHCSFKLTSLLFLPGPCAKGCILFLSESLDR